MIIALAQLNPTVGDLVGNSEKIIHEINLARLQGAELVVFSELTISGYPPRDLVNVEDFVSRCADAIKAIGESHTKDIAVIIGTPLPAETDGHNGIANSLVVYQNNKFLGYYDKRLLPTYDVFDEDRYFTPGSQSTVIPINGLNIGLAICEDLWKGGDAGFSERYNNEPDPVVDLIDNGAQIIIAPSASPFVLGKNHKHLDILSKHAKTHQVPIISVNQIGANDDLIFAGQSAVVDQQGCVCAQAKIFNTDLLLVNTESLVPIQTKQLDDEQIIIEALTLGIHDYVTKCGFTKVCLGLSGGIDSAIVATLAARALDPENVLGVSMPGKFSSDHSKTDAFDLAENLGMDCISMPIESGFKGVCESINPAFQSIDQSTLGETLPDVTQENLQSRIRGTMMMALSNRTGALVLTTGNKSEIAVGYCTLYGDMNGGLAVIADLPKTMVFQVCRYLNKHFSDLGFSKPPIPTNTIEKPPSAELAPNQLDSDSLPDYDILDQIIHRHIEGHQSAQRIIDDTGFDSQVVTRICKLIDRNEYKRQQMAVGLKVTSKAFGPGRRMPIAQRWTR
ncbi:MAG: NAD+ synthase [Phycisphaerales bacterium]|nr:NAD+ synthase [Phycisphaerales bacterium]